MFRMHLLILNTLEALLLGYNFMHDIISEIFVLYYKIDFVRTMHACQMAYMHDSQLAIMHAYQVATMYSPGTSIKDCSLYV